MLLQRLWAQVSNQPPHLAEAFARCARSGLYLAVRLGAAGLVGGLSRFELHHDGGQTLGVSMSQRERCEAGRRW